VRLHQPPRAIAKLHRRKHDIDHPCVTPFLHARFTNVASNTSLPLRADRRASLPRSAHAPQFDDSLPCRVPTTRQSAATAHALDLVVAISVRGPGLSRDANVPHSRSLDAFTSPSSGLRCASSLNQGRRLAGAAEIFDGDPPFAAVAAPANLIGDTITCSRSPRHDLYLLAVG
jgi:hypothetical protein